MTGGPAAFTRFRTILVFSFLTVIPSTLSLWDNSRFSADLQTRHSESVSNKDFYWIDVKPTEKLIWHKCYQPLDRECARLLVPLNHLNHTDGSMGNASIALIRKPSPFAALTHPNDTSKPDPRYRGPILFNPGGPGGSGVDLIHQFGDNATQILGEEFDIVGFDPRGVGRSTPKIRFFDDSGKGEREVWVGPDIDIIRGGLSDPNPDVDGEKGQSIERMWARSVVMNKLAGERGGEWLGNINTEQTARDMLTIVKAHGREKLMYWGFSYGTVLGATFAALFPDKFERLVLDGVDDAENYYASLWNNNLLDTSLTMNRFFEMCHSSGSASCAFWAPSPELISANLTRIYRDLIKEPIPVRTSTSYSVLDYPRVRSTIFNSLFSPWAQWPAIAEGLADLGSPSRNPLKMWNLSETPTFRCPACSPPPNKKDQLEEDFEASLAEASTGIMCSDGVDIFPNFTSTKAFFENFSRTSEWADVWGTIPISCAGWPKAPKGFQGPIEGKTDFPILFVGNTADPVTPLANAKAASKRFPGSRVLTQDSPGHTSINAPSVCTLSFIKEYFVSGTLPPEGTICPVISSPFPPAVTRRDLARDKEHNSKFIFTGGQEGLMRDVVKELSKVWGTLIRAFI